MMSPLAWSFVACMFLSGDFQLIAALLYPCMLHAGLIGVGFDVHGSWPGAAGILQVLGCMEQLDQDPSAFVVLNGDIVDRGRDQIAVLLLVLAMKLLYGERFIVTKGNHEVRQMQPIYRTNKQPA